MGTDSEGHLELGYRTGCRDFLALTKACARSHSAWPGVERSADLALSKMACCCSSIPPWVRRVPTHDALEPMPLQVRV